MRSQNINTRYTFMHSVPKKVHIVNEKCESAAQKSAENPLFASAILVDGKGVCVQTFSVK